MSSGISSAMQVSSRNCEEQTNIMDCLKYLCNNDQYSDVQFEFPNDKTKIYGHKFILSIRSSVFRTMFYGAVTEVTSTNSFVKIVDVSSASFLEMLTFIYTDQVDITDNNLAEIMYVSHKYSITHLERMCCDYLRNEVNKENCLNYLEQFYVYDNDFTEYCLGMIDSSIRDYVADGKLNELSEKPLLMILKRDSLEVEEFDLFKSLLNWAKKTCEENGVVATIQNMREKYCVFEMVRFPTMSIEEITECHRITNNQFFTVEEIFSIFNYKSTTAISDSLRYSIVNRHSCFGNLQFLIAPQKFKIRHEDTYFVSKFTVNEIVKIEQIFLKLIDKCIVTIYEKSKIIFQYTKSSLRDASNHVHLNLIVRPNVNYTMTVQNVTGIDMYCLQDKIDKVFNFSPDCCTTINGIAYKLKQK